jgi:uncharacterized protein YutE (UPF0331/DUF86 family)
VRHLVIDTKIESLRRCVERINSKKPFTTEELRDNFDLQDIVSVNLERAVQKVVDVAAILLAQTGGLAPSTMARCFDALRQAGVLDEALASRLRRAVGLRNLLVYEYSMIDWALVHDAASKSLKDFRLYILVITQFLAHGTP